MTRNSFVDQGRHDLHDLAAFFIRKFRFIACTATAFDSFEFIVARRSDKLRKGLFGRAVARKEDVDRLLDVLFRRHDHIDIALDLELDGVPETHVRRVRHGNNERLASVLRHVKRNNLVRLALVFGDKLIDLFIELDGIELDVRNFELAAKNLHQLILLDEFQIDKNAAETLAARSFLLFKGFVQLFLSNKALVQKHFTNTLFGDTLHLDTQNVRKLLSACR